MRSHHRRGRRPRAALLLAGLVTCCSDASRTDAPVAATTGVQTFTHDAFGVSFEVPANWTATPHGDSVVFSGAEGSEDFFTTMSLQALPRTSPDPGKDLGAALRAAYGTGPAEISVSWEANDPAVIAGRPAVAYRMTFTWNEVPRRRTGVLVDTGALLVDLSYAADAPLFDRGLPTFVRSVESLSVF